MKASIVKFFYSVINEKNPVKIQGYIWISVFIGVGIGLYFNGLSISVGTQQVAPTVWIK